MIFNSHTHTSFNKGIEIQNCDSRVIPSSYFSIGNHPWYVNEPLFELEEIRRNACKSNCLAIGEIGLDKTISSDLHLQKSKFIEQIHLSEELNLPIIIHCVKSWNEIESIKKKIKPKQRWIFHGFNKTNILHQVIKNDLMISLGASVLTNEKLQNHISEIPNNQLLLETDDKEIDILDIYQKVSELKNISLSDLEKIIKENFTKTFTKWHIG